MPKIVDHEQYSDELAFRSFDIIATDGIDRVSMRDLANRLGVSTGVLYHYFSSKDELLKHMCDVVTRRNVIEIASQLSDDVNLEERMDIILAFVKNNKMHLRKLLMLSIDLCRQSQETLEALKIGGENYRKGISGYTGVKEEYAVFIHSVLCGITYYELFFPGIVSYEDQMQLFKKMFVYYLNKDKK